MAKDWVIHTRHTCHQVESVVDYLSQYTYRIAISDQRLVAIDGDKVRFRWKDYAANGLRKVMSLDGVEFIRRFLMHVLPTGFMRIRHYGFMANCHRKAKLCLIRQCLGVKAVVEEVESLIQRTQRAMAINTAHCDHQCPKCGDGFLRVRLTIKPVR